jgi:hypothetical protein
MLRHARFLPALLLVGCGGAPFLRSAAVLSDEASVSDPPLVLDAGDPPDAAPESGAMEAQAVDPVLDAGLDADDAQRAVVDAGNADASDASDAVVNAFPVGPYGPAGCRNGADCLGDTAFNATGADANVPTMCVALEDSPGGGRPGPLSDYVTCLPTYWGGTGAILCQSEFDCSGYPCVSAMCDVETYGHYDGGGLADVVGSVAVAVRYCQGIGVAPLGCSMSAQMP